jgi:hypothetical protein
MTLKSTTFSVYISKGFDNKSGDKYIYFSVPLGV